jgi:signal peptidase II
MIMFLVFLIIIDQLTKLAAQTFLQIQTNSGSFLGIYIGKFPLFSLAIAFLALVILLADLIRRKKIGIGEILILAGGVGNLIDRLFRPGVVDWINFYGLWFNLADTYITLGVTLIICKIFLKSSLNSLVIRK